MKKILLPLLLLVALAARAEDPAPIPPNPFGNLPPNEEGSFSPFEDDFDGAAPDDSNGGARDGGAANLSRPGLNSPGIQGATPYRPGATAPRSASSRPTPTSGSAKVEPANCKELVENFDYPDAEILDVAKAIAKLTGKNFIYNPQDIKGRISVVSQTPITVCDAWNAFLTSLNMRGFALVPSGKYLRIDRIANAKEKQTPIYSKGKPPNNDEFITRVIPLRYIDATEFEQAFRLWMPREARMQAYGQTNTIIITDTASHINRMMELINLLDVAGYQESLVVLPIKNATAKEIAKLIEQILNNNSGSTAQRFGVPIRPQGTFNNSVNRLGTRGRSGGSSISKIIADDRTNALIVKANAAGILEIRALVRRLDQKVAVSEGSGRIHVIRLQFADAETLAKTLQQITGGGATTQRSSNRAFPAFGIPQSTFQGDIKVAADKPTQSLVVTASPADFSTLKKVVETLDVPRDQVFIEALILEIRLNRDNAFGTSFVSASNGIALPSATGNLTSLLAGNPLSAGGFVLGFRQGATRTVSVGGKDVPVNSLNGLLELVQGNSDTNVIATPKIIALDNEEAIFEISDQIMLKNETTTNGSISTNFTPEKAQTLLKVTPQINKASNFVRLNIEQKLENFDSSKVPADLQSQTQGKNIRSTTTKAIVQNDDTVVLSGLIRDEVQEITRKVPLLGDIPVLGWLFKNTKSTVQKTNLLVFITPHIIKQYDQIRKVLNNNLDEREDFIRENLGSRDPSGKKVTSLRKSLPDLTVIEPLPQKQPQEVSSFSAPSAPDDRDYPDEDYYDPNSFYYPPEGVPLSPVETMPPGIEPPMDDGSPVAPVVPQPMDDGGYIPQ